MMKKKRGTHFDPELFDLFMDNFDEVLRITESVQEEEEEEKVDERDGG